MIYLILGGARSGKSQYATQIATQLSESDGLQVSYIAPATAIDDEMKARIQRHQRERPDTWHLIEEPLAVSTAIRRTNDTQIVLVDCLTLWLNNQIYHCPNQDFECLFADLIAAASASKSHIIFVSNEVGLGVIPMGEVTRQFVDQAGWMNQAIAKAADEVKFIAAGLPMSLKSRTNKVPMSAANAEQTSKRRE
ncbi:bifunctional adenosylcobinamide kinase/adenosylcobinamide-phosphate guanylyltransferase [Agaribacter marinus]|uniref:Bifunctional adenosylcobalamin biosynthesis protein n=1 Tax=Agaribacter marinus TaxID=1431249 RepID=A0AA37T0P4_9ALTE|nr:bifunctional adenosylcobinamide kinase/adenosylcobinamide-phosphate guanylyltransferase [Agaribacter marinus]GLR71610.1 adenosylcobinamide kinase/adenosylcobinamide phosphate guanyltransferase [Agaribacter marinus]